MAKMSKVRPRTNNGKRKFPPSIFNSSKVSNKVENKKKGSKALERKQWKNSNCSVCMEYPHNAVLLLCSSYNKGCRPYMCETSLRYSNCLEQYKKAYGKLVPNDISGSCSVRPVCFDEKMEITELLCPLCRGQVKGWAVVEPARKYFNTKRRACMKDKCSFIGNYKELRKHVKVEHPSARPREVDPKMVAKWNQLEQEREREDVISTIQAFTPGAVVMGDYVMERDYRGSSLGWESIDDFDSDDSFESDDLFDSDDSVDLFNSDDSSDEDTNKFGSFLSLRGRLSETLSHQRRGNRAGDGTRERVI